MEKIRFEIKKEDTEEFCFYLQERENSKATIEKYLRDIRKFFIFIKENEEIGEKENERNIVDKEKILAYKDWLMKHYAVSSTNSMLVALNQYLLFREMGRLKVKRIKAQRTDILGMEKFLDKKDFQKLVETAKAFGKDQIAMIMETICATGIRISELKYFCVENLRRGMIRVWNKGKYRVIIIPTILKKKLLIYIEKKKIKKGIIFCTRTGKEKDRSNIWREMKKIAELSGVSLEKVFPHNLRHLFARTFYRETKNLIHLADILGHNSLEVTKIYTTDSIEEWRKNMEKIKLLDSTT